MELLKLYNFFCRNKFIICIMGCKIFLKRYLGDIFVFFFIMNEFKFVVVIYEDFFYFV